MKTVKVVKLPEKVKAVVQLKQLAAQAAQRDLETYLAGCFDVLGLNGDYEYDPAQGAFVPRKKEG